jgi:hypothetical protein
LLLTTFYKEVESKLVKLITFDNAMCRKPVTVGRTESVSLHRESVLYMNSHIGKFGFKLKYDYAAWANQILNGQYDQHQYRGYFLSFMFNHIQGSMEHRYEVMEDEIDRVYATLVRHAVRDGRSKGQRDKLPRLYAFPDYPGTRSFKWDPDDVAINGGLHYHGILLVRTDTRLLQGVKPFIQFSERYFVKPDKPLRRLWIGDIEKDTIEKTSNYALKAMDWRVPESNRMVIKPNAYSELPDKRRRQDEKSWGEQG